MFFKTNLYIFAILELVQVDSKPVTISLQPDEIQRSFKSIVSSDYIKMLANEFATKAAEHYIKEIEIQEKKIERDLNNRFRSPKLNIQNSKELVKFVTDKPPILNEEQAMTLLDDPSPDGDNLGDQLTDTEEESESKTIPVIGVMKINGVYSRRLLGMI